MHFAFVILHYGPAEITMEAVESILKLEYDESEFSIIIVDNASPGNSGKEVQQRVSTFSNVHFISNETNLGFARGNNVGFKFAKYNLKADFIILMNNDTVIESTDFFKQVQSDYQQEQFAVLGPFIYTPNGVRQNPLRKKLLKGFRLKLTQFYLNLSYILTWAFVAPAIAKLRLFHKSLIRAKKDYIQNNIELHGSFLIFSPLYIHKFDGLDERTFMYCEEEFLFARCVSNKLKTRYNPSIRIRHNELENSSVPIAQIRRKSLFRIRNCLASLKIYASDLSKLK